MWFYSFASGTYCHWSWSQLCCLILGFTEYREKDWAKAGSSRGNGVRPWSPFLALCSSPSARSTEGLLSLTGSASFSVRLVFYTQAGGSPLLPQCSLGWRLQRSVPGVCEGTLFPCVLWCSPLSLRGELWLLWIQTHCWFYTKQVVQFKIPLRGNGGNWSHPRDHKSTATLQIEHLNDI